MGAEKSGVKEKNTVKTDEPKRYNVILLNDDFTPMDFVVYVLVDIFRLTLESAYNIMMKVHKEGKGIAGTYSYDIAMSKMQKTIALARREGFPLRLTVEEA